ncbi:hypothetical protein RIR_jg13084.t1 [Rhizophagus irregularis DAOM 181602=DAOM 197198]|nr:hypothetical protein RIR_jg13084.t1 [Rhizophagus irregularis DAOM 181602=DAOM 197198]
MNAFISRSWILVLGIRKFLFNEAFTNKVSFSSFFLDGCFWIIGRVGLQALKCVNDLFVTVTNSVRGASSVYTGSDFRLEETFCLRSSIFFFAGFVFGVWTRRKLDFFRRIGFQILTAASIFFTQDLESSFFVSLIVLIIKSKR